jgi:hypothetical protein
MFTNVPDVNRNITRLFSFEALINLYNVNREYRNFLDDQNTLQTLSTQYVLPYPINFDQFVEYYDTAIKNPTLFLYDMITNGEVRMGSPEYYDYMEIYNTNEEYLFLRILYEMNGPMLVELINSIKDQSLIVKLVNSLIPYIYAIQDKLSYHRTPSDNQKVNERYVGELDDLNNFSNYPVPDEPFLSAIIRILLKYNHPVAVLIILSMSLEDTDLIVRIALELLTDRLNWNDIFATLVNRQTLITIFQSEGVVNDGLKMIREFAVESGYPNLANAISNFH